MIKSKRKSLFSSFLFIVIFFISISGLIFLLSCKKKEEISWQEQQATLQNQINELKQTISEKDSEISRLNEEIKRLQEQIPVAHTVEKGDSHYNISMDYLMKDKGLGEEEARNLLKSVKLFHPLLIGFKIWNYYFNKVFGTFITQGEAKISPGKLYRIEKKKIEDNTKKLEAEKAELLKLKNELESKISELNKTIEELNSQIKSLTEEKNNLISKNTELEKNVKELESKLNSLYYIIDTKDKLKGENIIKSKCLGLKQKIGEIEFEKFTNRIDLREKDFIEINASELNLTRIKKIKLLPEYFTINKDYRIEISSNGSSAKVSLLNKDKFLLSQIILIVF
ncbi:MAG: hypothetical protein AB1410_03010 [Acidobacteriota bacterium]